MSLQPASAADEPEGFTNHVVLDGLAQPTGMAFLPDGRLLITEKSGEVVITDPGSPDPVRDPYLSLPNVSTAGPLGLRAIAVDGEFDDYSYIYLWYPDSTTQKLTLARYTHAGSVADPASRLVVFEDPDVLPGYANCCHLGGLLTWGPDDALWLGVGDKDTNALNNSAGEAQDPALAHGKLLRLQRDGSAGTGNPFDDAGGPNLDSVWAMGLRNPWKGTWDRATERLVFGEVGQDAWEDINVVDPFDGGGENFGWPDCEGPCTDDRFTDPLHSYAQGLPWTSARASITGGPVYRGNMFPSEWVGRYFFGDFANHVIRYLELGDGYDVSPTSTVGADETIPFATDVGPIVDLIEGPDGALYYLSIWEPGNPDQGSSGYVGRIAYDDQQAAPDITLAEGDVTAGAAPLTVAFAGRATDPDGDQLTFRWVFGDGMDSIGADVVHTYSTPGRYLARLEVSDGTVTTTSGVVSVTVGPATSVTGTVFEDGDGDGVRGAGEGGIGGVKVVLRSVGADGVFGGGDDGFSSVVTGADGVYVLGGVAAGPVKVSVKESTVPAGLTLTTGNNPMIVDVVEGGHETVDFGFADPAR